MDRLTEKSRQILFDIVCHALKAAVNAQTYAPSQPSDPALMEHCGCFVTYKTATRLRGCLGCFSASDPLYQTVAAYAKWSATEDPRFTSERLTPPQLKQVHIDISVLSPLKPCAHPEKINLGAEGIFIQSGMRSGCFLPQVATETGWTVEEFWGNCCSHKAGLPYDAWRQPDINLYTFTADIIEGDYREAPPPVF